MDKYMSIQNKLLLNIMFVVLIVLFVAFFIITIMILLKENKKLKEERNHTIQALNILTEIFFAKDDNKDVNAVESPDYINYTKEKYKCIGAIKEMLDMGMSEEQIDKMLFHSLIETLEKCTDSREIKKLKQYKSFRDKTEREN